MILYKSTANLKCAANNTQRVTENMKILYWFILGIFGSGAVATSDCTGEEDSTNATKGHPFFLNFDYDGTRTAISYSFSKDGVAIDGDNVQVFLDTDRIIFLEIKDSDAGTYTLEVQGSNLYRKSIRLCGKALSIIIFHCSFIIHDYVLQIFVNT